MTPIPICQADLDGDEIVGTGDLIALLGVWGTDPDGPPDFDGDGNVGTSDLIVLLGDLSSASLEAADDSTSAAVRTSGWSPVQENLR